MFKKMCKNDKRMILSRNLRCVCTNWGVSDLQLWSKWKSENIVFFVKIILNNVTEIIRELLCGINGFSMTEITDIVAYLSTN